MVSLSVQRSIPEQRVRDRRRHNALFHCCAVVGQFLFTHAEHLLPLVVIATFLNFLDADIEALRFSVKYAPCARLTYKATRLDNIRNTDRRAHTASHSP